MLSLHAVSRAIETACNEQGVIIITSREITVVDNSVTVARTLPLLSYVTYIRIINSTEFRPSWKADALSSGRKFRCSSHGTGKLFNVFTRVRVLGQMNSDHIFSHL